jgi:hypothetical protein
MAMEGDPDGSGGGHAQEHFVSRHEVLLSLTNSLTNVVEVRFVNANRCEHRLVNVLWISSSVGHTLEGRRHHYQATRIRAATLKP